MPAAFGTFYSLVKQIPAGCVASYGDIAALAGNPRWSRVVGYAMRACTDAGVPCHRVVYQDGSLCDFFGTDGSALQRALLMQEGAAFLPDGRVDMARCRWKAKRAAR